MTAPVQETLEQALVQPAARRLWTHNGCGGYVLWNLQGGFCLHCHAAPLHAGEYEKAEGTA